jgi:hypothetical protein
LRSAEGSQPREAKSQTSSLFTTFCGWQQRALTPDLLSAAGAKTDAESIRQREIGESAKLQNGQDFAGPKPHAINLASPNARHHRLRAPVQRVWNALSGHRR